ncbi:Transcriptional regulatory protein ZraR [Anatilimnocola aggregata]|uniref:Transcriptional regulatory protein ZraR n=1 Tax=Anatilimnocola aggregata TaxID=2528021 RepID=A0A517Y7C5_9BACT|nr:sigma 54-interacting transcriptional regulator [Anatilimnocola aggregata]QDU26143.1 Transcriptional regulatory protein ZraR [Anatilimnocola aggregata]
MLAYLVIREGSKWTDVFRLVPGRTVTIGRAGTNQIVIKDERCSRNHVEVFLNRGEWTLRDLDSRNGTFINNKQVRGDNVLSPGDIVRIANCQLGYVHDLTHAFPDPDHASVLAVPPQLGDETVLGAPLIADTGEVLEVGEASIHEVNEPTHITHRRNQTRYLRPGPAADLPIPRVGQAAAKLCRLAFELASQPDIPSVAHLALNGLFEGTHVDAGAVLLVPRGYEGMPNPTDLQVVASRTDHEPVYHRPSSFLAATVLRDGEAVLARNIEGDSQLGLRDSKGEFHATSVMCAPVRQEKRVIGLIHLYSTEDHRVPDPDDLEFTLAVAENMALALRNLQRQQELAENLNQTRNEIVQLRKQLGAESELVGSSLVLNSVQQQIARAAPSRATVLIRGESGVGKELVARAMHYASPRKKGPFVCLNCAALSESLLESELFGHERGAFTGATERKIGKFEAAHAGTLMLDEIGEMSPQIQAKFLRVLEGHPFERVGGAQPIKTDVRVIAATNRDLERAVADSTFRRDLYFRLRVVEIYVPPLRKRPEDILELAAYFLDKFNSETGRKLQGFTPEAIEQMQNYRWPGNVRELKNVIERAVVLSRSDLIEVEDLNLSSLGTISGDSNEMPAVKAMFEPLSLEDIEKRHILATLTATNWNKSRTASILGVERSTLDRKIKRYELRPPTSPRGDWLVAE